MKNEGYQSDKELSKRLDREVRNSNRVAFPDFARNNERSERKRGRIFKRNYFSRWKSRSPSDSKSLILTKSGVASKLSWNFCTPNHLANIFLRFTAKSLKDFGNATRNSTSLQILERQTEFQPNSSLPIKFNNNSNVLFFKDCLKLPRRESDRCDDVAKLFFFTLFLSLRLMN